MDKTIGQRLQQLVERAGLTRSEFARLAGYKTPSGVQAILSDDYNPRALNSSIAHRIADALEGKGEPPIAAAEVLALTGYPIEFVAMPEIPTLKGQPKDVPIYGTALAADLAFDDNGDGSPVEQTLFEMGEVITYARRPPGIAADMKVYALYVSGSSMDPRYRPGDPLFVDPRKPPSIGDDVVVQLIGTQDDEPQIVAGLIKTLVRRTGSHIELEQYNPQTRFRVPMDRVAHIHRVIPTNELFGV